MTDTLEPNEVVEHEQAALVVVPDGVLLQHVADETVLLQLDSGIYYTLDQVGTRMLDLACSMSDAESIVGALLDEYDTDSDTLRADLDRLVAELEAQSLVVRNG